MLETEIKAIKLRINYCFYNHISLVTMETDSLQAKRVINGIWEVPWLVSVDVRYIKDLLTIFQAEVVHTMREENHLADFSLTMLFVLQILKCTHSRTCIPKQTKSIILLEKEGIPNIRIKKVQNKEHALQINRE